MNKACLFNDIFIWSQLKSIARYHGITENAVSVNLNRVRKQLKAVSLRKGVPLMKKEDFLKLMDGIDDRLVEKYAISDEAEARQNKLGDRDDSDGSTK